MVTVPLRLKSETSKNVSSREYELNIKELESKITKKTKFLLFNTPHNPTGKIFNKAEIEGIAKIMKKHNVYVLSDEVYEQQYFDEKHERIANVDGMWERTLTVGSAGKMFGITGWRIGWVYGPDELIAPIVKVFSRTVFCSSTPMQQAVSLSLNTAMQNDYFEEQRNEMRRKRNFLVEALNNAGLTIVVPQGGYFMIANTEKLKFQFQPEIWEEGSDGEVEPYDYSVCRWMTKYIGVTAIPPSAFYSKENIPLARFTARFCFCKTDETLQEAKERLLELKKYSK